jgi:hypothetical protein
MVESITKHRLNNLSSHADRYAACELIVRVQDTIRN